mmetsp:Transcript_40223/g.129211  ORF Transcript_40223/g.129211 Transcript_40223/m.129211 type:complete len:217 (+) Transcript_40223:635-1285(+)
MWSLAHRGGGRRMSFDHTMVYPGEGPCYMLTPVDGNTVNSGYLVIGLYGDTATGCDSWSDRACDDTLDLHPPDYGDISPGASTHATAPSAHTHPTKAISSPARGTSTEVSTASAKRRTTSATCAPPTTSTCRTITPPGDPGPTATSARTTATVNIGSGRAKLVVLPAYRLRPWALCALCRTSWQPWAWARVGPGPAEPLRDGRRDFGVVQGTCRDP